MAARWAKDGGYAEGVHSVGDVGWDVFRGKRCAMGMGSL